MAEDKWNRTRLRSQEASQLELESCRIQLIVSAWRRNQGSPVADVRRGHMSDVLLGYCRADYLELAPL